MIALGVIENRMLKRALLMQRAVRDMKPSDIRKLLDYATEQTRENAATAAALAARLSEAGLL